MAQELPITPRITIPGGALRVMHSRAGGPGGQNVNTRATRVQLFVDLARTGLHPAVLARLKAAHPGKLTQSGELLIACASHRSQDTNQQEARERLVQMVLSALQPPKPRRKTRPSRRAKARRMDAKSRRSVVKKGRGKPDW